MKRRGTYQRPACSQWWMHPLVFFVLTLSFGSIAMALFLRITGLLP